MLENTQNPKLSTMLDARTNTLVEFHYQQSMSKLIIDERSENHPQMKRPSCDITLEFAWLR